MTAKSQSQRNTWLDHDLSMQCIALIGYISLYPCTFWHEKVWNNKIHDCAKDITVLCLTKVLLLQANETGEKRVLTLSNFSEFCFCIRAFVLVRVELHSQLMKCLLYLAFSGISGHTKNVIVVFSGQDELGYHQNAHCKHHCWLCCGHGVCLSYEMEENKSHKLLFYYYYN